MRFSSSAHKRLCGFLAVLFLFEWCGIASLCRAGNNEPVLFLKYSNQSISDETARRRFNLITAEIERTLDVRASLHTRTQEDVPVVPGEIGDGALKDLSRLLSEAGRKMDRLENRDAERDLERLEKELRKYRLGEATRPMLADVFLKRGILFLWEENLESATGFFKKARALRPGFEPDPAFYSPQFRQVWSGIGNDYPVEAEILVESIPPGARILVDDAVQGMTPRRLKVPASRPVRLRIEHAGFQPSFDTRQWLPGDSERIKVVLAGDREARLARFLERDAARIREAAPIVSEIAKEAGVERIAFLMIDRGESGEELRVLEASTASSIPQVLGSLPLRDGPEEISSVAEKTARMLAAAGWPARFPETVTPRRPWYHSWWFLTGVGLLAAGTAVALSGGGGGGSGDSSSSSTGVNF